MALKQHRFSRIVFGLIGIFLLVNAEQVEAVLTDRGNGLVYDDFNNISWTKDANVSGLNSWAGQVAWADSFSLAGFDDFRLPSITELANLYGQLPGAPGSNKTGDISPFEDIQSSRGYWSGTEFNASFAWVFNFFTGVQAIDGKDDNFFYYGWAVRAGDSVAAVPEPVSSTLMLIGLGALGLRARLRSKHCCFRETPSNRPSLEET